MVAAVRCREEGRTTAGARCWDEDRDVANGAHSGEEGRRKAAPAVGEERGAAAGTSTPARGSRSVWLPELARRREEVGAHGG